MDVDLAGRRVVVCGAAGGIGSAAVRGFAERGASIAAIYNNAPPPSELAEIARWYRCDLSSKREADVVFDAVAHDLGGVDALVQAAGTWRSGPPETADGEQLDFLAAANIKSTIFANQAAFRHMRQSGGSIVNFGSIEGIEGAAESAVYAATRAAVQAWTRSVALAWGKYGITVNAIAPIMRTGLFEYGLTMLDDERRAQLDDELRAKIPIDGTPGNPLRDCVPVLAFLVSGAARFVTGQLIPIDGGMRMVGA